MILEKIKFFVFRVILNLFFLSIPTWVSIFNIQSEFLLVNMALGYFLFLCYHWMTLGKEINYRLKVYTRSNSAVDRILERMIVGAASSIMLVNIISLLPFSLEPRVYLALWLGWIGWLSWPTSRKMLERKISNDFSELKFLNGFEKLSLATIFLYVFSSYPSFPKFSGSDSVRIYFDSKERFHDVFWEYLDISLFYGIIPDDRIHSFFYVFLYFFIMIFTLSALYAIFRYFWSRSLSFLGTVTFVGTWALSLYLNRNMFEVYASSQYVLFYWTLLWVLHSSSYRSGLLLGASLFMFSLINPAMVIYQLPIVAMLMIFVSRSKSRWYQVQLFKYLGMGLVFLSVSLFTYHGSILTSVEVDFAKVLKNLFGEISRKSIYLLFIPGLIFIVLRGLTLLKQVRRGELSVVEMLSPALIFISIIYSFLIAAILDKMAFSSFALLAVICFVSISTLKLIFQKLHEHKSRKNLVFCLYLLIALLDSRLEERVKILLENF